MTRGGLESDFPEDFLPFSVVRPAIEPTRPTEDDDIVQDREGVARILPFSSRVDVVLEGFEGSVPIFGGPSSILSIGSFRFGFSD
jgi:hypothetical protein